jgi:hypothetical protein
VSWDADRYSDRLGARPTGQKANFKATLQNHYPIDPQNMDRYINEPCVVPDRNGKILFWYLPDALTPERKVFGRQVTPVALEVTVAQQKALWQSLLKLDNQFHGTIGGSKAPWRINPINFKDLGDCLPPPGNINLSPAWFQQAHEVCSGYSDILLKC